MHLHGMIRGTCFFTPFFSVRLALTTLIERRLTLESTITYYGDTLFVIHVKYPIRRLDDEQ